MTRDELIMLFYDGELDAADEARARELLARDPAARALLAELELLGSVVEEIGDSQPTPSDITAVVMDRLAREPSAVRPVPVPPQPPISLAEQRRRPRRALVGVAAVLALAAAVALLLAQRAPGSTARNDPETAAPAAAISAPEPDPPEQSVAIERIDFGEDPGAIFLVPGTGERTVVVWTIDDAADNGPEIEL
jgi:anti-sigma factor RsiW